MTGDAEILAYNIRALWGGIYDPMCILVPPENALEMAVHDIITASCYAAIPVVLILGWRYFMWLKHLGLLIIAFALFIFACGLNHLTGLALELGGYVSLDLITARLTTVLAVTALVMTIAWWDKIKGPLKQLGDALANIDPAAIEKKE